MNKNTLLNWVAVRGGKKGDASTEQRKWTGWNCGLRHPGPMCSCCSLTETGLPISSGQTARTQANWLSGGSSSEGVPYGCCLLKRRPKKLQKWAPYVYTQRRRQEKNSSKKQKANLHGERNGCNVQCLTEIYGQDLKVRPVSRQIFGSTEGKE